MNITCLQEHFIKAMNKVTRIIQTKPQLPILSYCLLIAENGAISITATNLETTIKTALPGKIEKEGRCCLPAKIVQEFLSSLSRGTVSVVVEKETIVIESNRSKAKIPSFVAAEFPPTPEVTSNTGTDLVKEELLTSLSLVSFSAATDEARPLLTGVRMEPTEEGTTVVSTDGYRMSMASLKGKDKVSSQPIVIPARAVTEVIKQGNDEKEAERIRITESIDGQLTFTFGDTQLSTRRIEGDYPNYKKIIPSVHETAVTIDTEELARAVKSASIFARDSAGVLRFSISPGTLEVSANTPQIGENKVELEAEVEGEDATVALNSRFLIEFLSNVKSDQLIIRLSGALSPVVFRIPKREDFLHIIMPVRIQG